MPLTRAQVASFSFFGGGAAGHAPADGIVYTIGGSSQVGPSAATDGVYFPIMTRPGLIRRVYFLALVTGTLASAGNTAVRIRNVTQTTEEAVGNVLMSSVSNLLTSDVQTLAFVAGDVINVKFTTPTWATNPTAVFYSATIEVEYGAA